MPEHPDIVVYVERLRAFVQGRTLQGIRVSSPFLVRTFEPRLSEAHGRTVTEVDRIGKRLVLHLDGGLHLVIHLMIAGRLRWKPAGTSQRGRNIQAVFDFSHGCLVFTEASKKKRASIHLVAGEDALEPFHRGGLRVHDIDSATFTAAIRQERHTLKRTLTDPRILDGIGNAYSDEILHRARLSPVKMSTSLDDDQSENLHRCCISVLDEWTARLRDEVGEGFPDKVTAFHPRMAVHGRYQEPCPVCESAIQRIVHGDNATNYCPTCQTGGKLLADRALSRLLKKDWPKTLTELEDRLGRGP